MYEIWRTWEDCLWFQEVLEERYVRMSHEKRQRLRAGKGVKKNGMYIHDRAASFESLPNGPDPRSVAKDVHQYFPTLSRRGTIFTASQATVDQRQSEFSALMKAFFQEDVPALIKELREKREVRHFFGYWRRDQDLAAKRSTSRPKTAPADGISTRSFISSFFSASSVTLSRSHTGSPPISPRSASLSKRPSTADSTLSLPDAGSVFSAASTPPSSAPARLDSTFRESSATSEDDRHSFGQTISIPSSSSYGSSSTSSRSSRNRATSLQRAHSHSHGTKASSSPQSDTFNVSSDFPLFLSSSTRELLPARPPHSPSYVTPGLETLQEDATLDSSVSNLPTPTLRRRRDSPVNLERSNRSVAWPDADEVSSSEGSVFERELLTPVDGTDFNAVIPSTGPNDSGIEMDLPHMTCTDSFVQLEDSISPSTASSSSLTLNRYRRRRSLSQPMPLSLPTDVGEGDWPDQAEDYIEAFMSAPEPCVASNADSIIYYDDVPNDFPLDVSDDPNRLSIMTDFSTPQQQSPYIGEPPRASRRSRVTAPSPAPPPSSRANLKGAGGAADNTLFVKAALDDAMVAFRARRDVPFAELRERVIGKFARSEGTVLRGAFELSYLPSSPPAGGWGRFRGSTLSLASAVSMSSVADWSGAVPLRNEADWAAAVAECGQKITVRVTFPGTQ